MGLKVWCHQCVYWPSMMTLWRRLWHVYAMVPERWQINHCFSALIFLGTGIVCSAKGRWNESGIHKQRHRGIWSGRLDNMIFKKIGRKKIWLQANPQMTRQWSSNAFYVPSAFSLFTGSGNTERETNAWDDVVHDGHVSKYVLFALPASCDAGHDCLFRYPSHMLFDYVQYEPLHDQRLESYSLENPRFWSHHKPPRTFPLALVKPESHFFYGKLLCSPISTSICTNAINAAEPLVLSSNEANMDVGVEVKYHSGISYLWRAEHLNMYLDCNKSVFCLHQV